MPLVRTITFPWKFEADRGGGVKRHGFEGGTMATAAVGFVGDDGDSEEDLGLDFLGRCVAVVAVVKGFVGAEVLVDGDRVAG